MRSHSQSPFHRNLRPEDIEPISSAYLAGGRKNESWRIDAIEVSETGLSASVSMPEFFTSTVAGDVFHLPVFTALEFVSQLQIVYMHVWAGLERKTREVWLIENTFKAVRPIRDRDAMQVDMVLEKMKWRAGDLYCTARHRVNDKDGGLFEVWIKALMPSERT